LRLADTVTQAMRVHVQRSRSSPEAGGILLGRLLVEHDDVVVDEVTVPGAQDRSSRFRFFRAQQPAQMAVNEAWARSDGSINYLGEWHTHPEDDPKPSLHDRQDWRRLVTSQRYEQDGLFFVIVGRQTIRAWELPRSQHLAGALPLLELADTLPR
jgi:integrative and conjugative element protein (TIGR02256 family)